MIKSEEITKHKNIMKSNFNITNNDKLIYYIVLLDILFFPYMRVFKASLTMLLLPIWFVLKANRIKFSREKKFFLIMLFPTTISFILSMYHYPQNLLSNISSFIILVYGFLIYFFFDWNFIRNNKTIKKILLYYLAFVFLLALIYFINPALYFEIRSFWTMSGTVIEVNSSLLIHRFTGTFSDPNNLAITINAILFFLFYNTKPSIFQKFFIFFICLFILFMTMSSTGFVLFGIFLVTFTFFKVKQVLTKPVLKKKFVFVGLILIFSLPLVYLVFNNFFNSDIVNLALQRFENNSVSSRTVKWESLLKNDNILKSFFIGDGGTVMVNNETFYPHNGHLHLIYNYGFISYFVFIYVFFRIRRPLECFKYSLFILPFFLGFTVNVGIYEPRFINIMALLIAFYSASTQRAQNKNKKKNSHLFLLADCKIKLDN